MLGRGPGSATDDGERVAFFRQRPGEWTATSPLSGRALSRQQIRIVSAAGKLGLERLGRGSLRVNEVQRDTAEVQDGDIDAELFGNIANYPNPGMPDRAGLIGGADGTSLFLDEVGELGETLQAHLLRVLDSEGQYQRLGSSGIQRSDFRLIAATNRPPDSLEHDLQGRLSLRLETPGLNERREDILPIARELLRRGLSEFPELKERFFQHDQPRLGPALVEQLMMRDYTLHVRELDTLLWDSLTHSEGDQLEPGPSYEAGNGPAGRSEVDRSAIEEALARNDGNQSRASRDLGLKNRYVLIRLMKKHGL